MQDFNSIGEKSVCLVLCNADDRSDMHVYRGEIVEQDGNYFFINREQRYSLVLGPDIFDEIREVPEDLKSMLLNADYFIQLFVKDIPDDGPAEGYEPTGMQWH